MFPPTSPTRCSLTSREDGEPLIGSAPLETSCLLIEHDGPWGAQAVAQSRLPVEVRARLAEAHGVRVQLIRRHGRRGGDARGLRVFTAALADDGDVRIETALLARDHDLLDLDLTALAAAGSTGAAAMTPYDGDLWLVCTNGRRDLCCADLGRPVAAALATRWPDETWETTHLGGHRFAATLLALPSLVTLGRLLPEDAVAACEEVAAGRVPLDHHRGRAGRPPVAQVAEDHLRRELGVDATGAVRWCGLAGDLAHVEVAGERWEVEVVSVAGPPRVQSCGPDAPAKPTVHHEVRGALRRG